MVIITFPFLSLITSGDAITAETRAATERRILNCMVECFVLDCCRAGEWIGFYTGVQAFFIHRWKGGAVVHLKVFSEDEFFL